MLYYSVVTEKEAKKTVLNTPHKAGFVSIIGRPNVGKSTLMNVLVGERLSIITSKAQTTRHRIFGIVSGDNFQIVYSDTPGLIRDPQYKLHESMMRFVHASLEDADVVLYLVDVREPELEDHIVARIQNAETPIILVLNKCDLSEKDVIEERILHFQNVLPSAIILPISALKKERTGEVFDLLLEKMPEHPAYYEKDELTDRSERFFAAEIIREKILMNYKQEIPYSSEVVITEFKEKPEILVIRADIYVERVTQRSILIGHNGESIKTLGIQARESLTEFFGKNIFLETHVKVEPDWRNKPHKLNHFGYNN